MRIVALAAAVALLVGAPALAAPDRGEPLPEKIRKERQTLEKLKDEIKEKQQKSDEAQRKEASVLQELEEADHRIKLRREDFVRVSEKLREKDHEIADTNASLRRLRDGPLARLLEESLGLQPLLELLECQLQRSDALRLDAQHTQLVLPLALVRRQLAEAEDLHAIRQLEFEMLVCAAVKRARQHQPLPEPIGHLLIDEAEIDMA